jgi:hypothetical protein
MKMLGQFLLRFAILFGVMVCPWPGHHQIISQSFRGETRFVLSLTLPNNSWRVQPFSDPKFPGLDVLVLAARPKGHGPDTANPVAQIPFDSGSQGWIPVAMLIALVVATPLPWRARGKALLAGFCLLEIMIIATILVSVSHSLAGETAPAWFRGSLLYANHLLVENIWFNFVPSLLLWVGWLAWCGHWKPLGQLLLGGQAPVRLHLKPLPQKTVLSR